MVKPQHNEKEEEKKNELPRFPDIYFKKAVEVLPRIKSDIS